MKKLVLYMGIMMLCAACTTNAQAPAITANHPPLMLKPQPYFLMTMSVSGVVGNPQEMRQELLLFFMAGEQAPMLWAKNTLSEDRMRMTLEFTNANIHPGLMKGYLEHTDNAVIHAISVDPNLTSVTITFNYPVRYKTFIPREGIVAFIYFFHKPPELTL